jgi:hypothetical protein
MMQRENGLNYCVWPKKYAEKDVIHVPLPVWGSRRSERKNPCFLFYGVNSWTALIFE